MHSIPFAEAGVEPSLQAGYTPIKVSAHRSQRQATFLFGYASSFPGLIDLFVDRRDLTDPRLALFVFHLQDVIERPVEVVRNVRYLLV